MQDLRDAVRWVRGSPGAFSPGLLSLGLAIGATVAIFSLVNAILLRPLPVHAPHRLATISSESALAHGFTSGHGWNLSMWQRFQPLAAMFDGVLAWTPAELDLASGGQRQPVDGLFVSGSFFAMLGVHPRAGRLLRPGDDDGAAEGLVAVISERFWEQRFGRRDIVGDSLVVEALGLDPEGARGVYLQDLHAALAPADRLPLHQRLADRLQAVPGITQAAASRLTPLSVASNSPLLAQPDVVPRNAVSPGWFDVYGIGIRAGRDFDREDTASAPAVAIVNEAYVRRFFADRDPLGLVVDDRVVVGIAGNAVFNSLRSGHRPAVFLPLAQSGDQWAPQRTQVSISVRSESGRSTPVIHSLGAALNDVDPRVTFSVRTLRADLERSTSVDRLLAILTSFFGLQALLLGALGVYGVSSDAVRRQRRETAIRMALGLTSSGMIRLVLARVLLVTAAGIALGVPVSVWLSRFLAALLHGVPPGDPPTLIASAALLVLVGLAAAWGPARRAASVDPAHLLRGD